GTQLFDSLLGADVGDLYHGARSVADSQNRGLRLTLYLTGVPELMEIPWEFLYDPGDAFFLSQSMYTPLVRSLDLRSASPPRKLTLPMKILGMASAPQGFPGLDVDDERTKLARALEPLTSRGAVELEWLDSATLSELDRRVGNPDELHVIHYIGHGAYDDRTQSGILVFEDSTGGVHEVSGEELGTLLRDERSLRLVVLNSCEGARTSHVDPFSGVASSLLRCGLPAVVGMQAEITDEAAITFSERLYTALAQGFPIDAALTQARKAIFAAGSDVEFGTPVLFLRGENAQLFDIEGAELLDELPVVVPEPDPKPDPHTGPPPPPPQPALGRARPKLLPWALAGVALLVVAALAVALVSGGDDGGGSGGSGASGSRIDVGSGPIDVTASAGAVWTSNQTSGDISKVDPASRKQVGTIPISTNSRLSSIAAGFDSLWVLNVENAKVIRIAPFTKDRTPIQVDGRPSGIAVGGGFVWVTLRTKPAQLVRINPRSNEVDDSFEIPSNPEDVRYALDAVWVTSDSTNSITKTRLDGTQTQIPIGATSDDMAVGAGKIWVTNRPENSITRIDLHHPSKHKAMPVGLRPEGVAADERNVWVVNEGENSVMRFDAHSPYKQLERYTVGKQPTDVAVDEAGVAWVVNRGDNTLSRLEP
ncbi:MAG TPA: CHAT domain-containing protein, partial [Thermoleophilaceae bacterium]|nr:CHAT domain-containing protein [Thermoleophilaceae bacterium]